MPHQADIDGMPSLRPVLAALLTLGAAACGNAAAAPVRPPTPGMIAPADSVSLVQRLSEQAGNAVPDVMGMVVDEAARVLHEQGLQVNPVALRPKVRRVGAQWPAAGDALPADGVVVIWLGTPPTPPPVAPPPATQPPWAVEIGAASADQATPQQQPAPTDGGIGSGVTPGLEDFVAPPPPPRANIRTLPAAQPGTRLTGRASWYGPGFEGRTTACGTTFDPAQLTLASRELRCGTRVSVTAANGRSVDAVVTDWGPAEWTQRRFDLSQATFAAVAGLGAGVIEVTVEAR